MASQNRSPHKNEVSELAMMRWVPGNRESKLSPAGIQGPSRLQIGALKMTSSLANPVTLTRYEAV